MRQLRDLQGFVVPFMHKHALCYMSVVPAKMSLLCACQGGSDRGASNIGLTYDVRGWVRTARNQKTFSFIEASQHWLNARCTHYVFTMLLPSLICH